MIRFSIGVSIHASIDRLKQYRASHSMEREVALNQERVAVDRFYLCALKNAGRIFNSLKEISRAQMSIALGNACIDTIHLDLYFHPGGLGALWIKVKCTAYLWKTSFYKGDHEMFD